MKSEQIRNALKWIVDRGYLVIASTSNVDLIRDSKHPFISETNQLEHLESFLEFVKYDPLIPNGGADESLRLFKTAQLIAQILVDYGLLKKLNTNYTIGASQIVCAAYKLNKEGLEAHLKLQEHRDNERRFNEQIIVSRSSLGVSAAAVITSFIAVIYLVINTGINQERLDQSEKLIEMSETRLDNSIKALELAEKRHQIAIDNNKSVAQPVNVTSDKVTVSKPIP
ncbi:hypothetical protein FE810_03420 [Thalassotalea litorea]|uniref:Uncharacterized protein n=1 Tax=Thalassotalea litorea TaxID=2020715 RepID=A0A5R9IP66_9GAMM|nr:hypothetical protein [Thalassotalea litorea]TLU67345.1 hypothetical protein FE810_03420 [Thalassotalea litorea]